MSLLLVLSAIIAGLILLNFYINKLSHIISLENLPGPKSYPIIGCFFEFFTTRDKLFRNIRKWAKEFPAIYRLQMWNQSSVCPLLPADIETLLTSIKHINKSFLYELLRPWLQDGLLTSFGAKWQIRRKILTPAFHFNILQQFVTIFEEHSKDVVERLKEECEKEETEITPIITEFALTALCETAMGTTLNSEAGSINYKSAVHRFGDLFINRLMAPWLWSPFVYMLTPRGRLMEKTLNILHSFTWGVISERKKNFIEVKQISNEEAEVIGTSKKRLAMLDLLLSAHGNGKINEEGIREEVDTFMFEGHDTTSIALNFALMCFANNPDVQERIYEEIVDVFGDSDRLATIQDLQQLRYLDQCLKESLRLYPSVPLISRTLTSPITLSKQTFPANQMVTLHIFDIHRNPDIWENPEKFDPDRFLPENCVTRHPFAYIPFSAGPRNCIGQKFAMLEMKSIVSNIIRNYKMEAVTKREDIIFLIDIVLRAKDPIKIKFRSRK